MTPPPRKHSIILNGQRVAESDLADAMPRDATGEIDYAAIMDKIGDGRTCQDCDVCCSALTIFELGKPPMTRCTFQKASPATGCKIYGKHPPSCKGFACLWRAGTAIPNLTIPEEAKPNVMGWVASYDPFVSDRMITIHLDPAKPGAWQSPESMAIYKDLARKNNFMVAVGSGDMALCVITPKGHVYHKAMYPSFFQGSQVGAPQEDFY